MIYYIHAYTEDRQTRGIALDEANRKIYWGGENDDGGLFVTNMDGSSTRKLVDYDHATKIINIDLDAENQ